jgi:hypothetical protein
MVERPDLLRDPVGPELPIPPRQQVTWDVFDTAGVFVGSVAVPANVTPLAVTENGFVGVFRGDLDVEYVVRYVFALR